jgi:hypothetical protein
LGELFLQFYLQNYKTKIKNNLYGNIFPSGMDINLSLCGNKKNAYRILRQAKVLRTIFGPKGEDVTGGRSKC